MTDLPRTGPAVDVRPLLSQERAALMDLLAGLTDDDWARRTPCPEWSVHDLAVHLVHDDLRRLSGQRDGHPGVRLTAASLDELAGMLDAANRQWVKAVAPSLSPRLTRELLGWLAGPSEAHLLALEPEAEGLTVSWAGPGPHPNWLDVAREYTERWVHQQQIRQAVGRPGLTQRRYLEPVVSTIVHALPAALPPRPVGTEVRLRVPAPLERSWTLRVTAAGWTFAEDSARPAAAVDIPAAAFWRRAVRMVSHHQARRVSQVDGDPELVAAMLDVRAAIVTNHGPP
jgi:uncharacterized protein (TIGR03083 family)